MDISETYIKMCDCEEIQRLWQKATVDMLPSYCWDKEIERVCIMIWTPDTLFEKITDGGEVTNSIHVSIEWDKPLHHWTAHTDWKSETIWLPHQDQLQEMIEDRGLSPMQLASLFGETQYEILFNNRIRSVTFPTHKASMEQLWLAFVMKEKHNKVWDGSSWVQTTANSKEE